MQDTKKAGLPPQTRRYFFLILAMCLAIYIGFYALLKITAFSHDPHDSYTLQAMNWWKGKANLDHDYSYLELAKYKDKIYVSFPPVPSVVEFALVPFFGENTPNNLVTSIYVILSFALIVFLALKVDCGPIGAASWGGLFVIGSSLFPISMFGGIWYTAQALCFCLLTCCVSLLYRPTPRRYFYALICFALAIGCRPQTLFFAPALLCFTPESFKQSFKESPKGSFKRSLEILKYFGIPIFLCILYGLYNYIRFDSPFEFGHNYLREFQEAPLGQFNWRYMTENLGRLFRLPSYSVHTGFEFPRFDGFAFYIANPVFISLFVRLFKYRKNLDLTAWLLLLGCGVQLIFLLFHKTMGGWHFGNRYLVDMLPFIWLLILRLGPSTQVLDMALSVFGVALNCYGTYYIYLTQ